MFKSIFLHGAATAMLLSAAGAGAAERTGRMTVEIRIEGQQSWAAQQDHGTARISEYYRVVTHVKSDGQLNTVNVLDPEFAHKQIARAAAVQKRVAQAQQRSGVAAPTVPRTPAEQATFMAQMQQEQQACGADVQCLMSLSAKYAPVMNAMAMQALPQGAGDDVDLDAEEEARYYDYFGYDGCPTTIEMRVDFRAEGAYADVGGMVPWKQTYSADDRGNDMQRSMQCLSQQTVFDVRDGRIHTLGFGPPMPHGRRVHWDRLHGETVSDGEIPVTGEALAWVAEQLRHAPAKGQRSATITPERARGGVVTSGASHDGSIRVDLSWSFEPDLGPR
jgi:hypothetical protein